MGKTTAPLLSFDAAGQLAKTVVYSRWRGVKYARRHVIPANPRSTSQQFQRNSFATLREMWKLAPSLVRAPWDAFATGRPFTGFNAFIGENRLAINTNTDLQQFIGSPGSRGGLPQDSMAAAATVNPGELEVTFQTPDPPDGWTLEASVAVAFKDQAPDARLETTLTADEATADPWTITLTGLAEGELHVVAGWLRWTKPDGRIAYGTSTVDTATPAVT